MGQLPTPYPTVRIQFPSDMPTQAPIARSNVGLKEAFCECESDESFDDFFYYNSEGELVEVGSVRLESAQSERGGNSDGIYVGTQDADGTNAGMRNDESVMSDNMFESRGWNKNGLFLLDCALFLSYLYYF